MNLAKRANKIRHGVAVATAIAAVCCLVTSASAQGVDIEVPVLILDQGDGTTVDDTLDLANIVQTAARGITTVQEAPAIITVITQEDFRTRGWTTIQQMLDTVPGWMRLGAIHNQFPFPLSRGIIQSSLFMVNGVSMFDAMLNVPTVSRVAPIETIKRAELITGPGGPLWGANSFLGVLNIITKDAEDVDGVEADVGIGHGNGDREYLRGYVMAGVEELFSSSSKLFIHSSFETYVGPGYQMPLHMFSQPLPNPNSQLIYGPIKTANPKRSFLFNFDGKLTIGSLAIWFSAPLVERHMPLGFPGFLVDKDRPEDPPAVICVNDSGGGPTFALPGQCPPGFTETPDLACPVPPAGAGNDILDNPTDACLDIDNRSRANDADFFERYVMAEYRTRFAEGKAGLTFKGYFVQFVRDFPQLGILAPIPGLLEGGLAFKFNATNYRAGGNIDGDLELPNNARLLYGVEAFTEWFPSNITESRQGPGIEARFVAPYNLSRLPLLCPRRLARDENGDRTQVVEFVPECPLTFAFTTSRTVMGVYAVPQWRVTDDLVLDVGARIQLAPEALGKIGYGVEPLFSGSLVYGFMKDWHVKLNYAQGFRPPVFNNVNSNGDGVQIDGRVDIKNERSEAGQAEINARLYKGQKRIRELTFRADYSYTKLKNLIQIVGGRYENTGDRGIHSAEFLGRLYLTGGHNVYLGYTWMRMNTADKGVWKALPEHWFNLGGVFSLSDDFVATSNLRVIGAMEDPNRIVEYRLYGFDAEGRVVNVMTDLREDLINWPHEMVMDRLPASADLTLGVMYQGIKRLRLSAFAYNAFNARYFQTDAFADFEPRLEFLPNPDADFRFQLHATYTY